MLPVPQYYTLLKKYHFYAAHRNVAIGGKCANLHGHTYYVEVALRLLQASPDAVTVLFEDVDRRLEPIVKSLDHCLLLDRADPQADLLRQVAGRCMEFDFPTSAENLARWLGEQIEAQWPGVLDYVQLQETTTSTVRYSPQAQPVSGPWVGQSAHACHYK